MHRVIGKEIGIYIDLIVAKSYQQMSKQKKNKK